MLKELSLTNFKIFKRLSIDLATITVLIGPQGVGKSSIFDALGLLIQSSGQEGLNMNGPRMRGIQFVNLVHRQKEQESLGFGLKLQFEGSLPPITEDSQHTVDYLITFDNDGFREQRTTFAFKEREWEFRAPKIGDWVLPPPQQFEGKPEVTFLGNFNTLMPFRFRIDGKDFALYRTMMLLLKEISDFMATHLHLIPSNRLIAEDSYPDQGGGTLGGLPSITDVVSYLAYNWDDRDRVSEWLKKVVDRRVNFRRVADRIYIESSNALLHSIMNEGDGVRQLIMPLCALAVAEPGSLVAIEEPEIHLHPKAQAKLSQLFVDLAVKEDKRILLSTHSEHVLLAFLTALARGDLSKDDLAIYYFSEEYGVGKVERLTVDERGAVEGGLKGFFEAGLDTMERYLEAVVHKSEKS